MKQTDDPEWMTVAEVARKSRVTQRTVRNWIKHQLLKATKHGGRVLIHRANYADFAGR